MSDSSATIGETTLLDLPNELLLEILQLAYRGVDDSRLVQRRAAWKTRIAVEGTCRMLRIVSVGMFWGDGVRVLEQETVEWLMPDASSEDTENFVKLFFLDAPGRLHSFKGLSTDLSIDVGWCIELLERVRAIRSFETLRIHPCLFKLLPVMQRPWVIPELTLEPSFGTNEWTSAELVAVVENFSPSLRIFQLSVAFLSGAEDDASNMVHNCLVKLHGRSIEFIRIERSTGLRRYPDPKWAFTVRFTNR